MPRKQASEVEHWTNEMTEAIESGSENLIAFDIACIIQRIRNRCQVDDWGATVALRDYAQLLLARKAEARVEETKARAEEIKAELVRLQKKREGK